jgi:hypothetical protein
MLKPCHGLEPPGLPQCTIFAAPHPHHFLWWLYMYFPLLNL